MEKYNVLIDNEELRNIYRNELMITYYQNSIILLYLIFSGSVILYLVIDILERGRESTP